MKLWTSGRESSMLDDIVAGRKTVEGRLNRGKFAKYAVGATEFASGVIIETNRVCSMTVSSMLDMQRSSQSASIKRL